MISKIQLSSHLDFHSIRQDLVPQVPDVFIQQSQQLFLAAGKLDRNKCSARNRQQTAGDVTM